MINDILTFFQSLEFIDYIFFAIVVFLMILIVVLINFIKINADDNEEKIVEIKDSNNLSEIVKKLNLEAKPINFTSYEKEQEEKAIISYDELLSSTGELKLNYLDEEENDGISVKKVNLNNIVYDDVPKERKHVEVHMMSLKKEEEFLQTLKEFQANL